MVHVIVTSASIPPSTLSTKNPDPREGFSCQPIIMGARERPVERLRVIMFSAMPYEITAFQKELDNDPHLAATLDIIFVTTRLNQSTASLTSGARAVCLFATDYADSNLINLLDRYGVRLIALRYAGFNNVDVESAKKLGIVVTKIPTHAPTSIAEYTITLMLTLNRKVHIANNRVRDGNFTTHGLVGFDISDRTVGIIGTGKVGRIVARIMRGFGCRVLAYDTVESQEVINNGGRYVPLRTLITSSDILSLHAPLVSGTYHLLGTETLSWCKRGVHIINTSRGGLIDINAIIDALHSGQVGGLAMDVYEGEHSVFFRDHVTDYVDPNFQLLKSLPNVLITSHQASLTTNALSSVAKSTIKTLMQFQNGENVENALHQTDEPHSADNNGSAVESNR